MFVRIAALPALVQALEALCGGRASQRTDRNAQPRMLEIRRDLAEWNQHKRALVEVEVGNNEHGRVQHQIVEKQNIQIDQPRTPASRGGAAQIGLQIFEEGQQLKSSQRGLPVADRVEK